MIRVDVDDKALQRKLDRISRTMPATVAGILNSSAAEVRGEWRKTIPSVFDRPTPLTLNAPLFTKATPDNLVAEVFIRDRARGVPPSVYLRPEVFGGPRGRKSSEIALRQNAVFPPFYVPARDAPTDAFGNVPGKLITQIIRQVRATKGAGRTRRETSVARGRRLRRERSRGGAGNYFVLTERHGKLRPGIVYERITTGFGSAVRPILIGVPRAPRYPVRFDAIGLARGIFNRRFSANLRRAIARMGQ